jgi:hypothetical protein
LPKLLIRIYIRSPATLTTTMIGSHVLAKSINEAVTRLAVSEAFGVIPCAVENFCNISIPAPINIPTRIRVSTNGYSALISILPYLPLPKLLIRIYIRSPATLTTTMMGSHVLAKSVSTAIESFIAILAFCGIPAAVPNFPKINAPAPISIPTSTRVSTNGYSALISIISTSQ